MEYAKARNLCRVIVVNKIDHAERRQRARCSTSCATPSAPNACRSTCPPTAASASSTASATPAGDSDLGPGRRLAPEDHRPGRRGQRDGDGPLPRPRRRRPVGRGTARRVRAMPARRPPGAGAASCSARSGAGVKELLDIAEQAVPASGRRQPAAVRQGQRATTPRRSMRSPIREAHVIADVFKIVNDPFVGKLGIFRVYQGTVKKDTQLFIDDGKKPFKVGHLFKLKGKDHVEIDAGDPRRHRRGRQDRRTALRRGAARQPRRGPDPPRAAGLPQADVRPGGRGGAQGPGTEAVHRAAQAGRGRSRASHVEHNAETQRDRDPRPVRPAPARDARAPEGQATASR